jgi:hypothetical protein
MALTTALWSSSQRGRRTFWFLEDAGDSMARSVFTMQPFRELLQNLTIFSKSGLVVGGGAYCEWSMVTHSLHWDHVLELSDSLTL